MTDWQHERARFNALTPQEAKAILASAEGQKADFRSCMYCNSAHAHLANRDVLHCFACGMVYLKGYPVPVVGKRADDEEVTAEDMTKFQQILADA